MKTKESENWIEQMQQEFWKENPELIAPTNEAVIEKVLMECIVPKNLCGDKYMVLEGVSILELTERLSFAVFMHRNESRRLKELSDESK